MTSKSKPKGRAGDKYAHITPLPDPPKGPFAMQESRFIFNARFVIQNHFRDRDDVLVNGYGYLCHDTRDRTNWTVPDCIVAFGVDPGAIEARNGYVISEVGQPPDFVLEVASGSTGRNDYTRKRDIYASRGVSEYWRFDSSGGQFHGKSLSGDLLVEGQFRPVETRTDESGVTWGRSPLLGLDLCWDNGRLRFFDPLKGEYLLDEKETADLAATQSEALASAEAEVQRLQEELRHLRGE